MINLSILIHSVSIFFYILFLFFLIKYKFNNKYNQRIKSFTIYIVILQVSNYIFCNRFTNITSIDLVFITLLMITVFIIYLDKNYKSIHLLLCIYPVKAVILSFILLKNSEMLPFLEIRDSNFMHVLLSLFSCDILVLATLQALFLGIQEYLLHHHKHLLPLPAIETMETLLFKLVKLGVLFLSLTLVSGFIFSINAYHADIIVKTIITFISWLLFVGLLFGRWLFGWRGYTATYWILSGSLLLTIAAYASWKTFSYKQFLI